jgi:hypothetical protein
MSIERRNNKSSKKDIKRESRRTTAEVMRNSLHPQQGQRKSLESNKNKRKEESPPHPISSRKKARKGIGINSEPNFWTKASNSYQIKSTRYYPTHSSRHSRVGTSLLNIEGVDFIQIDDLESMK